MSPIAALAAGLFEPATAPGIRSTPSVRSTPAWRRIRRLFKATVPLEKVLDDWLPNARSRKGQMRCQSNHRSMQGDSRIATDGVLEDELSGGHPPRATAQAL